MGNRQGKQRNSSNSASKYAEQEAEATPRSEVGVVRVKTNVCMCKTLGSANFASSHKQIKINDCVIRSLQLRIQQLTEENEQLQLSDIQKVRDLQLADIKRKNRELQRFESKIVAPLTLESPETSPPTASTSSSSESTSSESSATPASLARRFSNLIMQELQRQEKQKRLHEAEVEEASGDVTSHQRRNRHRHTQHHSERRSSRHRSDSPPPEADVEEVLAHRKSSSDSVGGQKKRSSRSREREDFITPQDFMAKAFRDRQRLLQQALQATDNLQLDRRSSTGSSRYAQPHSPTHARRSVDGAEVRAQESRRRSSRDLTKSVASAGKKSPALGSRDSQSGAAARKKPASHGLSKASVDAALAAAVLYAAETQRAAAAVDETRRRRSGQAAGKAAAAAGGGAGAKSSSVSTVTSESSSSSSSTSSASISKNNNNNVDGAHSHPLTPPPPQQVKKKTSARKLSPVTEVIQCEGPQGQVGSENEFNQGETAKQLEEMFASACSVLPVQTGVYADQARSQDAHATDGVVCGDMTLHRDVTPLSRFAPGSFAAGGLHSQPLQASTLVGTCHGVSKEPWASELIEGCGLGGDATDDAAFDGRASAASGRLLFTKEEWERRAGGGLGANFDQLESSDDEEEELLNGACARTETLHSSLEHHHGDDDDVIQANDVTNFSGNNSAASLATDSSAAAAGVDGCTSAPPMTRALTAFAPIPFTSDVSNLTSSIDISTHVDDSVDSHNLFY